MRRRITRRRTWLLAGVAATVAVIVALLMTGLGRDPSVIASPLVGRAAPNFTLPQLDGPPVTLSRLRGQVVVINFWASWCAECQVEQAALDQTWQQFQDSGVVVIGVNFEDSTGAASSYVHAHAITYPVVEDAASQAALAYGLRGVPETFVVNQSGRVVNRVFGPVDAAAALYVRGLIDLIGLRQPRAAERDFSAYLAVAPFGSHRTAAATLLVLAQGQGQR